MKKLIYVLTILFALMIGTGTYLQAQTVVTKTKKWSPKKKNTIIGAGAGAVTGALISKNKTKGAVIGGVVGGGAGYLYGRHRVKKYPNRHYTTKTKVKH